MKSTRVEPPSVRAPSVSENHEFFMKIVQFFVCRRDRTRGSVKSTGSDPPSGNRGVSTGRLEADAFAGIVFGATTPLLAVIIVSRVFDVGTVGGFCLIRFGFCLSV